MSNGEAGMLGIAFGLSIGLTLIVAALLSATAQLQSDVGNLQNGMNAVSERIK